MVKNTYDSGVARVVHLIVTSRRYYFTSVECYCLIIRALRMTVYGLDGGCDFLDPQMYLEHTLTFVLSFPCDLEPRCSPSAVRIARTRPSSNASFDCSFRGMQNESDARAVGDLTYTPGTLTAGVPSTPKYRHMCWLFRIYPPIETSINEPVWETRQYRED